MDIFFKPASIAVIGASTRRGGNQIIKNLRYGFKGEIYPVNPNYKKVEGIPCFPSLESIPSDIDLAILFVPAPVVPSVLKACADKGILRAMIESAGFSEIGEQGEKIQKACSAIAQKAGMRIWGPNSMGLVDINRKQLFTFMSPLMYKDGFIESRVSLIVQSGMLSAGFLLDLMSSRNIGIGKVCSIGNKSDIDECDLLPYLLDDPETDSVALYLESIPRGRLFAEIVGNASKPVVVLKGGRSKAGAKAAMSHTSSLAGDSRLLTDILQNAGVTPAMDFHQMIELARALAINPDIPTDARLAVLTFSGAAGILTCDLAEKHEIRVAELSRETKTALGGLFPEWMPVRNPVDFYPAIERHWNGTPVKQAISMLLKDPNVDVILVHIVSGLGGEQLELAELKKTADKAGKEILFWVIGRRKATWEFRTNARKSGFQVFDEISRALECLSASSRFSVSARGKNKKKDPLPRSGAEQPVPLIFRPEGGVMDEYESKEVLKRAGISTADERVVSSLSKAKEAVREIGFPVVVKGLIPGEIHKTELGLVQMGIVGFKQLEHAFRMTKKKLEGRGRILVQQQVHTDYELIAGFLHDIQLGPCVMFGLGGIFSELEPDVRFALAPLTHEDAVKLIGRIRGRKLFGGFRGMASLDMDAMADLLVKLGCLGSENQRIEQVDINPVAVFNGKPVAVDATLVLGSDNTKNRV